MAAGRVALDIERHLQNIEERLSAGRGIRLTPAGVESSEEFPILHQPVDIGLTPTPTSPLLVSAEVEEFQRRDDAAAADAYRKASQSGHPGARAAAFLGLARVLRRLGNYDAAVEAYDDLAVLGNVRVAGQPAALAGRQGRCKVFEERRDTHSLTGAAADLAAVLYSGRWPINRSTFLLYREMLERWGAPPLPADSLARTESATELWHLWRRGDLPSRGRRLLQREHAPVLALWAGSGERAIASLLTANDLEQALQPLASAQGLALSVTGTDGAAVFGDPRTGISLTPDETRLPFIMRAAPHSANVEPQESVRRAVIISALSLAFALMAAAAFGLYRATTRQLLLARQQSDFVSAVSHEFRTPLTSMRHLTELLVSRSITSEERRTHYYDLLAHETERLHRMVESLLSFGRIDAGAYPWKLERADIDDIVQSIVQEFRREPLAAGHQLACDSRGGAAADPRRSRGALTRTLEPARERGQVFGGGHADSRVRPAARGLRAGRSWGSAEQAFQSESARGFSKSSCAAPTPSARASAVSASASPSSSASPRRTADRFESRASPATAARSRWCFHVTNPDRGRRCGDWRGAGGRPAPRGLRVELVTDGEAALGARAMAGSISSCST